MRSFSMQQTFLFREQGSASSLGDCGGNSLVAELDESAIARSWRAPDDRGSAPGWKVDAENCSRVRKHEERGGPAPANCRSLLSSTLERMDKAHLSRAWGQDFLPHRQSLDHSRSRRRGHCADRVRKQRLSTPARACSSKPSRNPGSCWKHSEASIRRGTSNNVTSAVRRLQPCSPQGCRMLSLAECLIHR